MEGKYLVNEKECSTHTKPPLYGTVNSSCEHEKGKSLEHNSASTKNAKTNEILPVRPRTCSCYVEEDDCDCSSKKKRIQLESWARYKTITIGIALFLFGVWIVIIAVVGQQGKL